MTSAVPMRALRARQFPSSNRHILVEFKALSPATYAPPGPWRQLYSTSSPGARDETVHRPANVLPEAANPPATTRPPPLELPERNPDTSTFSYLFSTGKAYLNFYKTGLKNILHNRQLLQAASGASVGPPKTRSHLQLQARSQHDLRCLPIFGVLLFVCGEFTPFIVLVVPSLVPFTCRIPAQVAKIRRTAEARRKQSFADLSAAAQNSDPGTGLSPVVKLGHVARSLGLVGSFWDRIGPWPPAWLAQRRVESRLRFLTRDDELLTQAGGVPALEDDEVQIACAERGIDVLDRSVTELRTVLGAWLRSTPSYDGGQAARERVELLTRSEDKWSFK